MRAAASLGGVGERLVERGIPFLVEKPLAAADADGPVRLAAAIDRAGLVVAVGYHWRGLDICPRSASASPPAATARHRALARRTPPPAWWGGSTRAAARSIEQATHLYDLARLIWSARRT